MHFSVSRQLFRTEPVDVKVHVLTVFEAVFDNQETLLSIDIGDKTILQRTLKQFVPERSRYSEVSVLGVG